MVLFATPFVVAGGCTAVLGVNRLLAPGPRVDDFVIVFFGLFFAAVGLGLLFQAALVVRQEGKVAAFHPQHPDPWMRQADWAAGRIPGAAKAYAAVLWYSALLFCLFAVPLLWTAPSFTRDHLRAWVAVVVSVLAVSFLIAATLKTLAARKFGTSYLELASVPGVIGGKLQGVILTRRLETSAPTVRLTLTCVTRIQANDSFADEVVWEAERDVDRSRIGIGPNTSTIPLDFDVPGDLPQTNDRHRGGSVFWRVDVAAEQPGLDYRDSFLVPVFRTAASPARADTS